MNPFNNTLDWSFRGKKVRVRGDSREYIGWLDRIHHQRGSVVLHDAHDVTDEWEEEPPSLGSVFIRTVKHIEEINASKTIKSLKISLLKPSPYHNVEYEPVDAHMRSAYRNGFTGSFPVVRAVVVDDGYKLVYRIVNGHKRIEACRRVGLERHPVEVIRCTDEEEEELVKLAHREEQEYEATDVDAWEGVEEAETQ